MYQCVQSSKCVLHSKDGIDSFTEMYIYNSGTINLNSRGMTTKIQVHIIRANLGLIVLELFRF